MGSYFLAGVNCNYRMTKLCHLSCEVKWTCITCCEGKQVGNVSNLVYEFSTHTHIQTHTYTHTCICLWNVSGFWSEKVVGALC